jgi:ubiquinone/menaquinone biosynthesis C-methylase UbiE
MWTVAFVAVALVGVGAWLILNRVVTARTRREVQRLANVLELHRGSRVADVGSGRGTLALQVARLIGPTGHVYATEIDGKRRRRIRSAASRAGLSNVSIEKASERDTGLDRNCCDAIFMRGAYHHLTRPAETNRGLREALHPSGRLAVIDFRPGWFLSTFFRVKDVPANRGGHGVPPDVVIDELKAAGFLPERRIENWSGKSYCLTFRRPA